MERPGHALAGDALQSREALPAKAAQEGVRDPERISDLPGALPGRPVSPHVLVPPYSSAKTHLLILAKLLREAYNVRLGRVLRRREQPATTEPAEPPPPPPPPQAQPEQQADAAPQKRRRGKRTGKKGTPGYGIKIGSNKQVLEALGRPLLPVVVDRDRNAAKNILFLGLRKLRGQAPPPTFNILVADTGLTSNTSEAKSRGAHTPRCYTRSFYLKGQ